MQQLNQQIRPHNDIVAQYREIGRMLLLSSLRGRRPSLEGATLFEKLPPEIIRKILHDADCIDTPSGASQLVRRPLRLVFNSGFLQYG